MAHETENYLMAWEDSADRVPVLWLHGFPLSNLLWDEQLAGLADVARSVAPDLRGHGLSDPTEPPYTMSLLADDCDRLLTHLGIEGPVVVAGLSMGGYLALELARRHPGRVAGLILAATRAGPDDEKGRAGRDAAARTVREQGVQAVVADMLPRLLAPDTYDEAPDLVDFVREMMLETSPDGVVGALAAMRDRPDAHPLLPDLDVPALVIHGAEDQLIPPAEAEATAAGLPRAELVLLAGAGHLPNLEQAEAFNEAVRDFLLEHYTAGADEDG